MSKFKDTLKNLKTTIIHKWYVFLYCCRFGIPWQGITHDMTNILLNEKNHKENHPHHLEYWVLKLNANNEVVIKMQWKYLLEMVADHIAYGKMIARKSKKKFLFADEYIWWMSKYEGSTLIHKETFKAATNIFAILTSLDENYFGFFVSKKLKEVRCQYAKSHQILQQAQF